MNGLMKHYYFEINNLQCLFVNSVNLILDLNSKYEMN